MFRIVPRPAPAPIPLFAQKVLVLAGIAAALYVAWMLRSIVGLVAFAALGAAVLAPAVDSLERRRVPSWLAIAVTFLLVLGFAAVVAFTVIPLVVDSVTRIFSLVDGWLRSLQDWAAGLSSASEGSRLTKEAAKLLSANNVLPFLREHLASLSSGAGAALGTGWGIVSATVSAVASTALAAVLGFVILLERKAAWKATLNVLPRPASDYLNARSPRLASILKAWLRGQALVGLAVAFLVYAGLWILEIFGISFDSKLNLAVVAGMLIFLPYVGFAVALLPAVAFALSMGGWGAILGVAAVYGATQLLESNFVTPYVMGRSLEVSPLLTFCTLLLMASLLGIPGAILAAPAAAVVALLYEDFVSSRR